MRSERRLAAYLALSGGIVAISWSAIFVRWSRMPGVSSAFYRMVIALPVLWAVLALRRPVRPRISPRTIWIAFAGGVSLQATLGSGTSR
jgi:drug/metabolite transporter (DMT)-like permease